MSYKCSCGREFEKQGAFNLHNYHCRLRNGEVKQAAAQQGAATEECEHEWNLLGGSVLEMKAREHGFIKYCKKCEVLK